MNLSTSGKIWSLLTSTERRSVLVLLVMMLIAMLLETVSVGLVIPAMSLLTQENAEANNLALQEVFIALGRPSQRTLIIAGMLILVAVYFVKTLFLAFMAWWQTRFAFGIHASLSLRLFELYLRQTYTFHLQKNSAQLIRNVTNEVSMFTISVSSVVVVASELFVLVGLLALVLYIEPVGALSAVCVLGLASWVFHRPTASHIGNWGEARQFHEGMRFQHLQQGLAGVKDVILLGREAGFIENFREHNAQVAHAGHLQQTIERIPRLWLEFVSVIGLAIVVISMLMQNKSPETVLTTLGLFAATSFRLLPSINRIFNGVQAIRFGLPAVNVLHAEFRHHIPVPISDQISVKPFCDMLEFDKVSFSYPNTAKPTVRNISLVISKGESVGFVGKSGSGKSTLVDICLGLIAPNAGEVRIDGKDIRSNLREWQNQIGYVPQAIYLTDDTLRRNVAFGLLDEQIDDAAVLRAINDAKLGDFLRAQPKGLETMVGERGVRLSGGQRQRIGIARALYHNPSVLVLDEASSALDTATELEVMQTVNTFRGDKTIIIVAHRLSTVEHCDKIFEFEDGHLVGQISHKELMGRDVNPEQITRQ